MAATQLWGQVIGIDIDLLTKQESFILEAELFARIYEDLKQTFKQKYQDYFRIMKFSEKKESMMFEANFVRYLIEDILLSEEYSLSGIACYTHTPEEVICDIFAGRNQAPSFSLIRKIINLHRSIRQDFYSEVMHKISEEYQVIKQAGV